MNNLNYTRLLELKELIDKKQASSKEKKEFIDLMYKNGNLTEQQYQEYLKNKNTDNIIQAALTIGGVLLATWLITKLFDK